ncbi:Hypothetical protein CINCED_3A022750 [Cinara cedri]|uniref:Uncharacterized protein n=1 Tax=Cinara cedri TaxID=506608 RepID=A0A5E4MDW9_9HEMI|nr:Hypothetical protein CINCED_3A022750 [Cinara cedri]
MSFSPEAKILLAIGASLLFFMLIYDTLYNKESNNESSIISILSKATLSISNILLFPCAVGAGLLVGTTEIFTNSQSVVAFSLNSSIAFISTAIVPLGITALVNPCNTCEWDVDHKLERVTSVIVQCGIVVGIATLGWSFITDVLAKSQQLFTILESVGSGLYSSASALLAVILAPVMMLASHCIFNQLQTHSQDDVKGHRLARDQAIESEKTQARSTGTIVTKQAERMEVRHEINHHDDFRNVFVNYITSAIKEANCSSLINSKDQKTQPSMVEGISTRTQENTRCR